ncbi:MAG: polysaccharide biosynthesis/export family protein [Planctomycetes bacterium]|nr:polysaccharide biosynthesis/export family protein [Planctomycetota bacterium]
MTNECSIPSRLRLCLWAVLGCLASCGSFEEVRIRELMHEKGFGTRANGDATRENYVSGLDSIQFLLPPEALVQTGAERLAELTVAQPVGIDGTIFVPFVGPVYVLGKTEAELGALVTAQLRTVLTFDLQVQARISQYRKFFYAIGETGLKGRVPLEPDLTLMDAMFAANWTKLANLGRVYVIRPDAENPLVVDVNFREMLTTGNMQSNIQIRERDILYVPPTFLGLIARLLERLLEPVGFAVRAVIGVAQIRGAYDVATGQQDSGLFFRF